ncbi:MAG: PAS domain S-box protein, partial [Proteobacteria bacterium]|nr:PAS domain S-box protein [Pseudomonadota bacterium]
MLKSTPSRKTWPAWVALGIGLLATVFASLQVKQGIEHDAVRQFAFASDQVTLKIQERLGAYALILRGGAALFAASKAVERHEWRAYVEGLQAGGSVPGVQGVGFAQVIPPSQLAAHIARIRREGFPDYTVRPPGERAVYTSIVYLEPFPDTVAQRQAALLGWAYSPYRMNDLMAGILGDWDSYAGKTVDLHIYAGPEATPATLLFDSKPTVTPAVQSLFFQQRTIDFNGQPWLLVFDRTSTVPVISYAPAWTTLAGGFALSGLLFGLILAVINTRVNAARIAEGLTDKIKRREALLQESEAFKLAILNAVPAEIAVVDRDGVILAVNEPWRRFALENGIEPGKPAPHTEVGTNYLAVCQLGISFAADDGAANARQGIQAILDGGLPCFSLEYPCHSPTQQRWFEMTVTPLGRDTGGRVVITHTDITGRIQLEEKMRQSETKFRTLYDSNSDAIMLLDGNEYIDCNQATLALFGVATAEEFFTYHPADLSPPMQPCGTDSKTLANRHIDFALKNGHHHLEWTHQRADTGKTFNTEVLLSAMKIEGKTTLLASVRDITERKQAEEKLRQLSTAVEQCPVSIVITDTTGAIEYVNPKFTEVTGYSFAEVLSRNPRVLQSGEDNLEAYQGLWDTILSGKVWRGEFHNKKKSGEFFWEQASISPIKDVRGVCTSFVAIKEDITERKQASEALQVSELRFRKLLQEIPSVAVQGYGPDGTTHYWNEASEWLYGYSAEEAIGRNLLDLIIPPPMHQGIVEAMHQMFETGQPIPAGELSLRHKDGSKVDVFSSHAYVHVQGETPEMFCVDIDLTERKRMEAALAEARNLLLTVIDTAPMRVFWKDRNLCYLGCNMAFAKDAGMAHPQDLIGKDDYQMGWAAQAEFYRADDRAVVESGIARLFYDEQQTTPAGQTIWLRTSKVPIRNQHNEVFGLLGVYEDTTGRKQAEDQLHLAASVFTHAWEGIMITAADGTIIDVNDAFSRITSYSRDEVLGQNPRLLSSGRQSKDYYDTMWRILVEQGQWHGEMWNRRRDGEVYAVMQTNQGMTQAQRRGQQRLAVAFLDLDGFKAINDDHGHDAGDQLLITVATRMKHALREGDTLARIGGDEFVAVLLDLADVTASTPMLDRLLAAAAQPVQFGGLALQVSASLGVTFYPQAEDIDADQLLRQADQAMYQAKLAGKNRYHIFDAEQNRNVRSLYESLERIRRALLDREFVLHYQPKVNLRTGAVVGAEALIRWQHPERGLLPPTAFLPVIENHPLAVELGEWVIDTALAQVERWQADGLDLPVSVNVGARQLQQADFVERLRGLLAAHPNTRPGHLELEVLETNTLELAGASQVIEACRGIGVLFALDDFGTGYSSMTYLKRLPVARIKIDQSFVRDMLDDPDDLAILEGVIGLAAAFHRQVVAEGVETVEHGEMLLQLGCELAQGYGIARPMPAADIPSWAARWRPASAWVDLLAVSRDDLPLLFAGTEHRAWIAAVESHLKGGRETPPPLDPRQCRFGKWLDAGGLARHGARQAFQGIDPLHRQVHALAAGLVGLQSQGRGPEARAMLGELHGMRDALLGQLQALVREIR